MELVYNPNFKAFGKTSFMNCVERRTWPVKTIHKIPIFEGEIKSQGHRKVILMHLQGMNDTGRMPLKANEKAACQACCSRAMSACCLQGNDL